MDAPRTCRSYTSTHHLILIPMTHNSPEKYTSSLRPSPNWGPAISFSSKNEKERYPKQFAPNTQIKTFSFSASCCCSLSSPLCLTEVWLILFLPLHCYLEGIYRVWSCSLLSFFPFQLWINQASSVFSHVSYLSRGHANCNGKPRKVLPVGEDTSEQIQPLHRLCKKLLTDSLRVCTSPGSCQVCVRVGLHAPACIRNRRIYLFPDKLASAIIYFILSHVIVSVLPSELEAAERKMNVGGWKRLSWKVCPTTSAGCLRNGRCLGGKRWSLLLCLG